MKTTQQWLDEVKSSPAKLEHWLERQYVGEALAAIRIQSLSSTFDKLEPKQAALLQRIAADEQKHRDWIADLLKVRNISLPEVTPDGTRYWEPILDHVHAFEEVAGAGHHAETMRLIRIEALAADTEIDSDIREVFGRILVDEQFHAKAFEKLSTPEAIEKTRPLHEAGLKILGLVI